MKSTDKAELESMKEDFYGETIGWKEQIEQDKKDNQAMNNYLDNLSTVKHGQEGTHGACKERCDELGEKVTYCECIGHKCKDSKPESWEERKTRKRKKRFKRNKVRIDWHRWKTSFTEQIRKGAFSEHNPGSLQGFIQNIANAAFSEGMRKGSALLASQREKDIQWLDNYLQSCDGEDEFGLEVAIDYLKGKK